MLRRVVAQEIKRCETQHQVFVDFCGISQVFTINEYQWCKYVPILERLRCRKTVILLCTSRSIGGYEERSHFTTQARL